VIDLQCGRLNCIVGGSALGSSELAWGGDGSFGRALLLRMFSWSVKIIPEIQNENVNKWASWSTNTLIT